jgi:hypothetical protein
MKKRNLFITIGLLIISALFLILYYVDSNSTKIDDKHINLIFNLENLSSKKINANILKTEVAQPLLKSNYYVEGKEFLFIPKIVCENFALCIPAFGINSFRYNSTETELSYYNKDDRLVDEEYFFSEWKIDNDFKNFLNAFNTKKTNTYLNLYNDILKQKSNLFIDSFIINSSITKNSNFEFKNTSDLRMFLNKKIAKFKIKNKINIYIFFMDGNQITTEPPIIIDEIEDETPPEPHIITDKIEENPPKIIKKPEQTISITHSNSAGKFIVAGINDINKYHVYMKIQQSSKGKGRGAVVLHDFKEITCPNKSESNKILGMLADPVDLTITVYVEDLAGKLITSNVYKDLSLICSTDKSCGFVDLYKISNR